MTDRKEGEGFQQRVLAWLMECFSMEVCRDGQERNHRFLEESLELVQALGCTRSEAHQLVDYVFDRPAGEPHQELGGVMVTVAALCFPHDLDMMKAAEDELARAWTKIDVIRAKQAAKPKHSPLPSTPTPTPDAASIREERLLGLLRCAHSWLGSDHVRDWWKNNTPFQLDYKAISEVLSEARALRSPAAPSQVEGPCR